MKSLTLVTFSLYSSCLWLVFASSVCTLCFCNNQNSDDTVECIATERLALIRFKNNLTDHANRLSSWSGEDCCSWSGVVCDDVTHHVQELRLSGPMDGVHGHCYGSYISYREIKETDNQMLGGIISPSLNKLEQLQYLDLSCNDFGSSPIPSFIGSLQNLRYLNISNSEFYGEIPHQLGNLSGLLVLDAHDYSYPYNLRSENLKWIENLKQLQYLDMSGSNLTGASDWLHAINTLPSLQELHLSSCRLTQISSESTKVSFTSLIVLDLSSNNIVEAIPNFLPNLCNMTTLDLQRNYFYGDVTDLFERLCECESPKLESLALRHNDLTGRLPQKLGKLKNLVSIDISHNRLTGALPRSIGELSLLEFLYLSYNELNGSLPESIGKLGKLIVLSLYHNSLTGIVTENHFANLTALNTLSVGDNKLVFDLVNTWIPPFQLTDLLIGSCNLGPLFPLWIQSQTNLKQLDLGNTNISDTIPNWFWNTFSSVGYLNISHNNIMGKLGDVSTFLTSAASLDLSSNHFHGVLPRNFNKSALDLLDLSSNNLSGSLDHFLCSDIQGPLQLRVLNLANNNISSGLTDCWMNWDGLVILNLENNRLSGRIPSSLGNISWLKLLDIHNNKLSGEIPLSLLNSKRLLILKLAENELTGRIPAPIGRIETSFKILSLRSNKLSGEIPNELCRLSSIQILDLADNNLSGYLPKCFTNLSVFSGEEKPTLFDNGATYANRQPGGISLVIKGQFYLYNTIFFLVTALDLSNNKLSGPIPNELVSLPGLRFLNLSHNRLTGRIPNTFGEMRELEALDLSVNHLEGEIPLSLAGLTALNWLNVSYNNLTGTIPIGRQFQTFNDESNFIGNGLCGAPLAACQQNRDNTNISNDDDDDDDDDKADGTDWILVICMIVGLAVGFWITIGAMIVRKRWRYAYYHFLDEIWIKLANFILLVCIHVKVRLQSLWK